MFFTTLVFPVPFSPAYISYFQKPIVAVRCVCLSNCYPSTSLSFSHSYGNHYIHGLSLKILR